MKELILQLEKNIYGLKFFEVDELMNNILQIIQKDIIESSSDDKLKIITLILDYYQKKDYINLLDYIYYYEEIYN